MKKLNEGDIVAYTTQDGEADTARVRRVYDDSLQLVNHDRGYQQVALDQVGEVVGQTEEQYFCGVCGWVSISQFPNCH